MTSTMAPGDVAYSSLRTAKRPRPGCVWDREPSPRASQSTASAPTLITSGRSRVSGALEMSRMRALDYDYLKTYVRTTSEVKALGIRTRRTSSASLSGRTSWRLGSTRG
jgi:hypothetical protein